MTDESTFRCQIYLKGKLAEMLNVLYESGQYYNYQDLFRQIVREWGIQKGLLDERIKNVTTSENK